MAGIVTESDAGCRYTLTVWGLGAVPIVTVQLPTGDKITFPAARIEHD
jgi:hypothetical protein